MEENANVTRWGKEGWRDKPVTFMLPSSSMSLAHPGDSCSSLSVATQFAALQRGMWVIVTYVKNDQNCYPNALGHADWIGLLLFVHNSTGLHIKYSLCSAALKSVNCYNKQLQNKTEGSSCLCIFRIICSAESQTHFGLNLDKTVIK